MFKKILRTAAVLLLARQRQAAAKDADVTYGRVKKLTPCQKVIIEVDNAVDKSYDLTDKDVKINSAKGLQVGDPQSDRT